jgi:thiol:disulfide interchange protein DsbD
VLRIRWVIADGYYLYRHKMQVKAESPDLVLAAASFPPGTQKTDPYLGTQEIFTQQVEGTVAYSRYDAGAHPLQIKVTYQGCAEAGLCYPPLTKVLFPGTASPVIHAQSHPWEGYAIIGGALAFLLAGLLLRKGRRLETPA